MRRIVIVVPDLAGEPSVLRQKLPTLTQVSEMGRVFKLSPVPTVETPEALYLGMRPDEGQLRQGPLTIAALGADPPPRSTHFHLSLVSFIDGIARSVRAITPEEQRTVLDLAKKLNTKLLTIVEGEGVDHGLVWESIGDIRTTSAAEVDGKSIRERLPEGDAEIALRRFIDDSINLLSETEINEKRADEELPPLNLLWPWGEGVRLPLPNLALRRGDPALVLSASVRLAGLSRLVGYRHGDRRRFGSGTNVRLRQIADLCLSENVSIAVIDSIAGSRRRCQLDEAEWLGKELDTNLLDPLLRRALLEPTSLTLLAPSETGFGLGLAVETPASQMPNIYPFDERSIDEKSLGTETVWESVARGL